MDKGDIVLVKFPLQISPVIKIDLPLFFFPMI